MKIFTDLVDAMKLSVLVCTHNRPEGLQDLLHSLMPQIVDRADREVVVVNDGTHSPDYATVVALHPQLRYEILAEPGGIAAARNRSAAQARGEYLVFTDDDCVVPSHWLDWLEARLAAHPELDVVAGTTKARDPEQAGFAGKVQIQFGLLPQPHLHHMNIQSFVTACLAVRASVFRQLGGFREDGHFAVAGEDTDLSFRLARNKARIRVDLEWWVRHVLAKSLIAEYRRHYRYGYSNGVMAMLPGAPSVLVVHRSRRRVGIVRGMLNQYRWNKAGADALKVNPFAKQAYRVALAFIRTGFDRGLAAAVDPRRS